MTNCTESGRCTGMDINAERTIKRMGSTSIGLVLLTLFVLELTEGTLAFHSYQQRHRSQLTPTGAMGTKILIGIVLGVAAALLVCAVVIKYVGPR